MPLPDTRHIRVETESELLSGLATVSDSQNLSAIQTSSRIRGARGLAQRTLLRRDSHLLAQGARFTIAGATVAVVYVGTTTLLADVAGLPFQVALIIGFCVALAVHFSLQRFFVWTHDEEFALPLRRQAGRYLIVAIAQYGLTVASTSLLPSALHVSTEVVYLATVAVVYSVNFVVFRNGIFHAKPTAD